MKEFNEIMRHWAIATGLATVAVDVDGNYISDCYNFTDFCIKLTRGSKEGLRRCVKCDREGNGVYHCHAGLIDFGIDLLVKGEKVGSVIGGQVLPAQPDEAAFRKVAKEIGVNEDEYIAALKKVNVRTEESINAAAHLLGQVLNEFINAEFERTYVKDIVVGLKEGVEKTSALVTAIMQSTQELKKLQKRLGELHNRIYRKKIPVILCYEGWDAAGKGGNIRRIARPLDPRGFDVMPIASPEPRELNRQYLWRFWTRLPRSGHICIFDRTWYGRVMVERLEGFCTEKDWQRAYNEINEFERQLTDWGAVVLKFWIHIDQDTQLARFNDRQNTPEKQWKLTAEDWRNREKWPQYEAAIDEMLQKTSTDNAPWYIIESNDKKYARIKTLRIVVDALEKACEAHLS